MVCAFYKCVCVRLEYVCKCMQTNSLEEQSSSLKLKKLRHYYQHEASCSLVMLCTDLPLRTWPFGSKAKAELDPLCRYCRMCIITNIKKLFYFRNICPTAQAIHSYSLVLQMSSLKNWAEAFPLCLGKLIISDQRKSHLFGGGPEMMSAV